MHYMLSGMRHARPATNPQNAADDFPCFGAMANYAAARSGRARAAGTPGRMESSLPAAVSLNAPANQVSANNHIFPGFFAGFLGTGYDPMFVSQNANRPDFQPLPPVENIERLATRRQLLESVERQPAVVDRNAQVRSIEGDYLRAFDVLTSPAVRGAFALADESPSLRSAYGSTPFGQGCLLARRLVERGVSLVTVNWERDDAFWDTHSKNFVQLKTTLCPNFDRGLAALLDDLTLRGLLDETLVVCLGEFGRTPQINARARPLTLQCSLLPGAGIPEGGLRIIRSAGHIPG